MGRLALVVALFAVGACEEVFELHHTRVVVSVAEASITVYRGEAVVFATVPGDTFVRVGSGSLDLNATIVDGALYDEPSLFGAASAADAAPRTSAAASAWI